MGMVGMDQVSDPHHTHVRDVCYETTPCDSLGTICYVVIAYGPYPHPSP